MNKVQMMRLLPYQGKLYAAIRNKRPQRRLFIVDTMFWHQKWKNQEIAFHQSEANPLLVKYFNALSLAKDSRVFVPLCGKTLDISWLLSHGYRVAGAELSRLAVEELFTELGLEPKITKVDEIKHYSAKNIDIFVGDIFELSDKMLGPQLMPFTTGRLWSLYLSRCAIATQYT